MYPKSNLKLGDWKATCDICGFDFHASELRKNWRNLYVCEKDFEPREELDFLQGIPDNPSTPWTRKDNTEFDVGNVGDVDKTLTVGTDNTTQTWNTVLTAERTATLSLSDAIAGDLFNIYKTNDNAFDLLINSDVTLIKTVTANSLTTCRFNGTAWVVESYTPIGL